MNIQICIFILIENIFITIEQSNPNNNETNNKGIKNYNNNNEHKIKQFLFHIGLILLFIIVFYLTIKLFIKCCKKRYAFQKLYNNFINNKLMNEDIIDQVRYVYGFNYVNSFLKEKIFLACKYKDKYEEIKNCGNCSICLNDFNSYDRIYITSCHHVYHKNCMDGYLDLIIKDIEPEEKEIENFHEHFHCPNCKEYLYANKSFLQKMNNNVEVVNVNNIEEIKIENDSIKNDGKVIEVPIIKSRRNIKIDSIITLESTSKRSMQHKKKNKKLGFKKNIYKRDKNSQEANNNNDNKNGNIADIITTKNLPYIEVDNNSNYQSNMKLKDNLEMGKNKKISYKVIRSDNNSKINVFTLKKGEINVQVNNNIK